MPTLDETEAFVRDKFAGKFDRGDAPMADHMMRVASHVEELGEDILHVAWLHDIVEDTDVTVTELIAREYSTDVVDAVVLLTHDKKAMTYPEYIQRICDSGNWRAIYVKLADQEDNRDPKRWLALNRYIQNALTKKYAGVPQKLMEAAVRCKSSEFV